MENFVFTIDIFKLAKYILKHIWWPILCFAVGFSLLFSYSNYMQRDTYTAYATMYVYNGNPNVINYQYTSSSDLDSAVKLIDTYMVVIRSNKVMNAVAERLGGKYEPDFIASTLSMNSVSETGVMRVMCTTPDPMLSAEICNAVMDIAPAEIIRVVSAGNIEVIDYAEVPTFPNPRSPMRKAIIGGLMGGVMACGVLFLLFLMRRRVSELSDITDHFKVSILSTVLMRKRNAEKNYLINEYTPVRYIEGYNQLRLNLGYSLKTENRIVIVSSSVPNEGKSTVTANLAISMAMDGKKVLLIDGDMRNATQFRLFGIRKPKNGLSSVLAGECGWHEVVKKDVRENLDVILTGPITNTPAEMLGSMIMRALLEEASKEYDIILIDTPPINVVTDALVLSNAVAGLVLVVRQDYSSIHELRRTFVAAEMTDINVLGVVYYSSAYWKNFYTYSKYYRGYYGKYDKAKRLAEKQNEGK